MASAHDNDEIPWENRQLERGAFYTVFVPFYGKEDQSPDQSVARAIHLSVNTNAKVYKASISPDATEAHKLVDVHEEIPYKSRR